MTPLRSSRRPGRVRGGSHPTGPGGGTGGLDPVLQNFIDNYGGKSFEIFGTPNGYYNGTPEDVLIATYTLNTPPATVVSDTEISLNLIATSVVASNTATPSPDTMAKYGVIDRTGVPVFGSAGLSSDTFNPRFVFNRMDMFGGDTIAITQARLLAANLHTQYTGTRSPSSGIVSGQSYNVTPQAADVGGSPVNIFGRRIVGSYQDMGGAGAPGSVDPTPSYTNRFGSGEPIAAVAGSFPKDERTHFVDANGISGNTSTLTVNDIVDNYLITVPTVTPGPGTTRTVPIQARLGSTNVSAPGRNLTVSLVGLTGSVLSTTSVTTNAFGVASVDVTFGAIGTTGTIHVVDTVGATGDSASITVSTAPPVYHHVLSGQFYTGAATPSISIPANAWVVVRANVAVDPGQSFGLNGGTGLTMGTQLNARQRFPLGLAGVFDQFISGFFGQAGPSGYTGPLTFTSTGPDGVLMCAYEIGYFSAAEVSGVFNCIATAFSATAGLKQLTLPTTPAVTSTMLSAWGDHQIGSSANWAPKASPTWSVDSSQNASFSGFGWSLAAHRFEGSDNPGEATASGSTGGNQLGLLIEVVHA